jgi:hypothetical protein
LLTNPLIKIFTQKKNPKLNNINRKIHQENSTPFLTVLCNTHKNTTYRYIDIYREIERDTLKNENYSEREKEKLF